MNICTKAAEHDIGINRYIVGCKLRPDITNCVFKPELIDT